MRKNYELDYGCMARAGAAEMTFVLLSRDACAPAAIRFWAAERCRTGRNSENDPQIVEAMECASTMERERDKHRPEFQRLA